MALRIINADERMASAHMRGSVFVGGGYKVGKTSLLYTLPEAETLYLDFESGDKSVQTWGGDQIKIRDFIDAVDIACMVGGVDPSSGPNDMFSQLHYDRVMKNYGGEIDMGRYRYVFFDSASQLSVAAAKFAKQQPESYTDKGKFDAWGMYGLIAQNMLRIVTHMQHSKKNCIFIGLLEQAEDAFKRPYWRIQMEGSKTARELPGIVDQVVTMCIADFNETTGEWAPNDNGAHRIFVCRRENPWGFPAGTRSVGNVDMIEEPHLGKLIAKLNTPPQIAKDKTS